MCNQKHWFDNIDNCPLKLPRKAKGISARSGLDSRQLAYPRQGLGDPEKPKLPHTVTVSLLYYENYIRDHAAPAPIQASEKEGKCIFSASYLRHHPGIS